VKSRLQLGLAVQVLVNQSYFFDCDKDGDLDMLLLIINPKKLTDIKCGATANFLKKIM